MGYIFKIVQGRVQFQINNVMIQVKRILQQSINKKHTIHFTNELDSNQLFVPGRFQLYYLLL